MESLDFYVVETLNNLSEWNYPEIKIKKDSNNVFLGSGNAFNVCLLLAKKFDGQAINVVNYKNFFRNDRSYCNIYIVSASGGKDAVRMAEVIKKKGLRFKLITNNSDAPAKKFAEKSFVFPSMIEPPTYNVSTYASMIYYFFEEDLDEIEEFIKKMRVPNIREYKYILFVTKDEFEPIGKMAARKIAESLSGIGSHCEGFSDVVHGFLIQPNKHRLIFSINQPFEFEGKKYELNINSYLGAMLSIYYIIGKNQTKEEMESIISQYKKFIKKFDWKLKKIM